MRITFVLGRANMRGGVLVVAIYAEALQAMGHRVSVVSTRRPLPTLRSNLRRVATGRLPSFKRPPMPRSHLEGRGLDWTILQHPGPVTDAHVPDADVVIATWWETAEWVAGLSPSKGRPVYFCQHFETHDPAQAERVLGTYRLPMRQVCVSQWVADQIRAATGRGGQVIVPNAVDHDRFARGPRKKNPTPRFGFMYSDSPFKAVGVAIEALERVRASRPEIEAVCFSTRPPRPSVPLPPWIECEIDPPQARIAEIYASCDAWLMSSRVEGFGLPLLEAMASRTPVISTPAGAAPELLAEGGGALVPVDDPAAMADAVDMIAGSDPIAWRRLSDQAAEIAGANTWAAAAERFEAALADAAAEGAGR
ncbi:MAG: glycosyltransferase family 4 protein [Planctomycetota bacterium]